MQAVFDAAEESRAEAGPFVAEVDVVGLYPADFATASRSSMRANRDVLLRVDV